MEDSHLESLYPPDSRFEEISKIISRIKSGNSVQLVSLPGVGRSNVLGLLAYNRKARDLHLGVEQKNYHFVLMNFSEIKNKSLSEITKYIFLELAESLKLRKYEYGEVGKIYEEVKNSKDELIFFQGLKKTIDLLALEKKLTIVLLFDRFDEYTPNLTPEFFSNLRVLRDRAKYKFTAIFPINRPLEESVGHDMLSDFYEFVEGNIVYLGLSDKKMLDFRISYLEQRNGKKIERSVLEKILDATAGHGKLTRVVIEEYFGDKDVLQHLEENPRVKTVLLEIWKALNPYEQALIQEGNGHDSAHLLAVGLIKEGKISIPLLETYAKEQKADEKIEYDKQKDEIKRGATIISHGLTSSEFKLLKYFVDNAGNVTSRDQIIEAVWGNLNSTSGVTEQALDQLIFRLRKKMEDNPNSPKHIETVKGRGFKFTP